MYTTHIHAHTHKDTYILHGLQELKAKDKAAKNKETALVPEQGKPAADWPQSTHEVDHTRPIHQLGAGGERPLPAPSPSSLKIPHRITKHRFFGGKQEFVSLLC